MAKRVEFLTDCTVRTVLGDVGRVPRAITEYKAGQSALIPDHHYDQLAEGVARQEVEANGDEGQGGTSGEAATDTRRAKKGDA